MLKSKPTLSRENHATTSGLNWWVFFWAAVVFIVYGSLFPFDFMPEARPLDGFYDNWGIFQNTPDAVDNFLLFVPLGIGLDACFRGRLNRFLAALTALLLLGVAIQLLQLYLPTRTAAVSDVLWNAVGMGVGMVAFERIRLAIEQRQQLHTGSHDSYAMLLVVVWFLYESFPFVPTLDVGLLRDHIKTAVNAPPFEAMRLLQHTLAAALGGVAVLRANWMQPRWLSLLAVGGLAVFFEVFVAYGSLRRETLAGIGFGMFFAYWLSKLQPKNVPIVVVVLASSMLLISLVTPYRGQALGSTFTFTPFSDLLWRGVTKDIAPTAFEGLAIGALFWVGVLLNPSTRIRPAIWIGGVFALLAAMEFGRVYLIGYHGDTTPLVLGLVLASFFASFARPIEAQPLGKILHGRQPAAARPAAKLVAITYRTHLVLIGVLAALIGISCNLPGVPYNVRELLPPGMGAVGAASGLAFTAYGMANGSFLLLSPTRQRWFMAFPAALLGHGILTWFVLRHSVPMESLLDVVGSPVLGWPWDWEMLCRYAVMHVALMMQLLGAVLCVRAILKPATLVNFVYWLIVNSILAWPLYVVVVQWADTDNLTELMANNANLLAASMLATAFFLTCLSASATAAALATSRRTKTLAVLAISASIGAAALFWLGTEHTIVKYGRVFSAFQFLLSTDRAHYVQGAQLMLRFGIVYLGVITGLGLLQVMSWKQALQGISK